MELYRQIFIPDEQNNHIDIPCRWYGKEVEVIVFPVGKEAKRNTGEDASKSARQLKKDLLEAVEEVRLHKAGKLQLKAAEDLLNEL